MGSLQVSEQQFAAALDTFVARAKQEPNILAVILGGSMSHDRVWEKSDIDLFLVGKDEKDLKKSEGRGFYLVENGINIHASLQTRSRFKQMLERSLQSSFMHSFFAKSRLVFTRDETIREWYDNIQRLGTKDREIQLLRVGTGVLPILYKAQKWLLVKKDPQYSYVWILHCVTELAKLEVLLDNRITGREVIQQALELNPKFFNALYTQPMDQKKTAKSVAQALESIDQYLTKKTRVLFQPILDYLSDQGAVRSATEIETYFRNQMNLEGVTTACEWLADKEVISKVSAPVRLFEKGRVGFEEMAFYYEENASAKR
ncbi:MAG: nucleotidyltransferase domain-containing protein [Planctomycetes bacterium]|nr:nucleotidyltransferase domain-containing protein [Planctomycetota bacterium]